MCKITHFYYSAISFIYGQSTKQYYSNVILFVEMSDRKKHKKVKTKRINRAVRISQKKKLG